jgi:hypothetical protein
MIERSFGFVVSLTITSGWLPVGLGPATAENLEEGVFSSEITIYDASLASINGVSD